MKDSAVKYCVYQPYASGMGVNSYRHVYVLGYSGEKPRSVSNRRIVYCQKIGTFDSRFKGSSSQYSQALQYAGQLVISLSEGVNQ